MKLHDVLMTCNMMQDIVIANAYGFILLTGSVCEVDARTSKYHDVGVICISATRHDDRLKIRIAIDTSDTQCMPA